VTATAEADHFLRRLLEDMLTEQTPHYWLRRAETFDDCNPDLALNCRRHAWLLADADSPSWATAPDVPWVSPAIHEALKRIDGTDPFNNPDFLLAAPYASVPDSLRGNA